MFFFGIVNITSRYRLFQTPPIQTLKPAFICKNHPHARLLRARISAFAFEPRYECSLNIQISLEVHERRERRRVKGEKEDKERESKNFVFCQRGNKTSALIQIR